MNLSVSATNLANHYHHNCDLYLHNFYHHPRIGTAVPGAFELPKAHLRRGIDWEKTLFAWLDRQNLLLTVPSVPLDPAVLYENIQADSRDHFFIAGLSFLPPQEMFNERFREAGKTPVKFSLAMPDLLEIRRTKDGIKWKVIDAKSSSSVKTSHHVQISFYTMCLAFILPQDIFSPEGSAAIWLPPSEGYDKSPPSLDDIKIVETSLLLSSLDYLLFEKLPNILSASREDVKWHYNSHCRGCPYEKECNRRALDEGELGSMPNISLEDAKTLRGLLRVSSDSVGPAPLVQPLTDIEDLHNLLSEPLKLETLASQFPSLVKRSRRILALPKKSRHRTSPVVEAARSQTPQIKLQRNLALPRYEDINVIMSLVTDPSSHTNTIIERYTVDVISRDEQLDLPVKRLCGPGSDLVPTLALLITTIISAQKTLTTQFYVWSSNELSALQAHLIDTALTSTAHAHEVRICIGALAQGASLLHTSYQPILLSGALLSFLTNSQRTKAEHTACLERLGLSTEGSAAELRRRVDEAIHKLQATTEGPTSTDHAELGQLPRVVVLKREMERLIALPVPGYWDLAGCASALLPETSPAIHCPTEEEIYANYRHDTQGLDACLVRRNASIYAVLEDVRQRIVKSGHNLLVNVAKTLSSNFMDLCQEEHIRKLFFVQQFEVLTKLNELWRDRIDGCPDAPVLEYLKPKLGATGTEHVFRLVSGTLDMPTVDKATSMFDKIIVLDEDDDPADEIPVEALFDDLAVSGLVFPLNKNTRPKWAVQHKSVQEKLWVADLRNMIVDGSSTKVIIQAWGSLGVKFLQGCKYRISSRLVDFNTSKALAVLLETDLRWGSATHAAEEESLSEIHRHVPLLQMITNPSSFEPNVRIEELLKAENTIQKLFRELKDLGDDAAGALVLKSSQRRAAQRILSNRLSVIWGPPGTGKTYTIALSILRLLDSQQRLGDTERKIILVTAMTHAAIDAVRKKLLYLIDCYCAIESLPKEWLERIKVENVSIGRTHSVPRLNTSYVHIYTGTTYQLYNFTKQHSSIRADMVVIDEAGQLGLSSVALVLRALSPNGKIIVAGDSEQLAPILSAQYPQLKGRPIFGSVLDCLMYTPQAPQTFSLDGSPESQASSSFGPQEGVSNFVQLTENFRLNPDLGEFVSTIYSRAFKPQKVQARQLALHLKSIENDQGRDIGIQPDVTREIQTFLLSLARVMLREPQDVLSPPSHHYSDPVLDAKDAGSTPPPKAISLMLLKLNADSMSNVVDDIAYETHVRGEAAVAAALVASIQRCSPQDDIFVATPHRVQREAVKAALARVIIDHKRSADSDTLGLENMRIKDGSDESDSEVPPKESRGKVTVDTVERLQGSEAAFVICLFSVPKSSTSPDLSFLLERRRLNVAISRAKTLCVVVASPNVLRPGVNVLAKEDTAKGYSFLRSFEERAWSYELNIDLDNF